MEQTQIDELNGEIAATETALQHAVKVLKKPSTISFAERRALSAKAEKALADVRERKAELAADPQADGVETRVRESLDAATKALGGFEASLPAGLARSGSQVRNVPGSTRRGATGGSHTSMPRRIGGE